MSRKRKYSEDYLKLGSTTLMRNGVKNPECVLRHVVQSAESMKPSKLERHLKTKHSTFSKKDLEYFERHEAGLKR